MLRVLSSAVATRRGAGLEKLVIQASSSRAERLLCGKRCKTPSPELDLCSSTHSLLAEMTAVGVGFELNGGADLGQGLSD